MKKTDWYKPHQVPSRDGWYERDHRKCNYGDGLGNEITLDLWQGVSDKNDILYPGVWYVKGPGYWWPHHITGELKWMDNINDASRQQLPWRGVLK